MIFPQHKFQQTWLAGAAETQGLAGSRKTNDANCHRIAIFNYVDATNRSSNRAAVYINCRLPRLAKAANKNYKIESGKG
jgi:hypothetical protein